MLRTILIGVIAFVSLNGCDSAENNNSIKSSSRNNQDDEAVPSPASSQDSAGSSSSAVLAQASTFQEVMDRMMQDMHSMKMTEDPDHDFAMMMKSHHQAAIDMSNIELSKGQNDELKQVAQKIIKDSEKDNTELQTFLANHQPKTKSDFAKKAMEKMMKSPGMNKQKSETEQNTDQTFAKMMVMHHQEGINMARDYLKVAKEEQTKKVANNTIASNGEDLKQLQKWEGENKTDHSKH